MHCIKEPNRKDILWIPIHNLTYLWGILESGQTYLCIPGSIDDVEKTNDREVVFAERRRGGRGAARRRRRG